MDDDMHPVVIAVVVVTAIASMIFATWCTVIAFIGGTIPIFGWELEGSVGQGVLFGMFVEPIIITVGYWIAMLITLPLAAIFRTK